MDKPIVLVVDDDRNVCEAICRVIEQCGCVAIPAFCFQQALDNAHLHKISFAITDWDLNEKKSGIDVGALLQSINPKLPLVFITGKSVSNLCAVASNLDIYCVLKKPVDLESLRSLTSQLSETYFKNN